jgi:mRNA-degrading endonuclease RelE of RelBE toxin-antitoxin system
MKYQITLSPDARNHFHALSAYDRAKIRDAIDQHLAINPIQESKSRIKRLRELKRPQYRLRVDDLRVFYDVDQQTVNIVGITTKAHAEDWLREEGERS